MGIRNASLNSHPKYFRLDNRVEQQNVTGLHPPFPPSEVLWCLQTVLILSLPTQGEKCESVRLLFPPALGQKFCLAYTWCTARKGAFHWFGENVTWWWWWKSRFEICVLTWLLLLDPFKTLLPSFIMNAFQGQGKRFTHYDIASMATNVF